MLPARRMRGVWILDLEESRFYPGQRTAQVDEGARPAIWLTTSTKVSHDDVRRRGVYAIDFVGRRTKYRVPSGHLGMYDYEIIADRIMSLHALSS